MPPIGLLLGNDFSDLPVIREGSVAGPYFTLPRPMAAAVTLNYGQFINVVVSF